MKLGLHCVYIGNVWLMLAATKHIIGWYEVVAFIFGLGWLIAGIAMIVRPRRTLDAAEAERIAQRCAK